MRPLLAKSRSASAPKGISLIDHTDSVVGMAELLVDAVGGDLLRAVGLSRSSYKRFRRLVLIAARLHDTGKANDHFQDLIYGGMEKQALWHETVSYYIFTQQPHRSWLISQVGRKDYNLVLWAIAGHHRRFPPQDLEGGKPKMNVFLSHPGFPIAVDGAVDLTIRTGSMQGVQRSFSDPFDQVPKLQLGVVETKLLGLLKAVLIAADVLGSIQDVHRNPLHDLVRQALSRKMDKGVFETIVKAHVGDQNLTEVQRTISHKHGHVILHVAGCGNGKTVTAYQWAKSTKSDRLFFCYPTMWSVGMGFDAYLQQEGVPAGFYHHLSHLDARMSEMLHQDGRGVELDSARRALMLYGTPILACTHDTILGVIRCGLTSLLSLPAICKASIVFDEIQMYSDQEFDALLRFVRSFPGIPILIMSATPQPDRRKRLKEACEVGGLVLDDLGVRGEHELKKRYQRSHEDPWEAASEAVNRGEKVLWISNTVSRCIAVYDSGSAENLPTICCHGNFKYIHKTLQQDRMAKAFDSKAGSGVLGAATQVAESSLNLSADLIVADLSAIWSIIQRLGRLKRGRNEVVVGRFIVVDNLNSSFPYTPAAIKAAAEWLKSLTPGPLSQADLMDAWKGVHEEVSQEKVLGIDLFEGRYRTAAGKLRPSNSFQQDFLMESDFRELEMVEDRRRLLSERKLSLYLPRDLESVIKTWRFTRRYKIIPDGFITYTPERGAQWPQ